MASPMQVSWLMLINCVLQAIRPPKEDPVPEVPEAEAPTPVEKPAPEQEQ